MSVLGDRLRQASQGVTPGPWHGYLQGIVMTDDKMPVCRTPDWKRTGPDARFIAFMGTHRDQITAIIEAAEEYRRRTGGEFAKPFDEAIAAFVARLDTDTQR